MPLPYLMYTPDSDPEVHIWHIQKAIKEIGETENDDIVNLNRFTLRDVIFKWGENFMQSHPRCCFRRTCRGIMQEISYNAEWWTCSHDVNRAQEEPTKHVEV